MISRTTKKYQKTIKELEETVTYKTRVLKEANEKILKLEAVLEVRNRDEENMINNASMKREELQSQVSWLRSLVEDLIVSPAIIKAKAKREIHFNESRERMIREERKAHDRIRMAEMDSRSPMMDMPRCNRHGERFCAKCPAF